MAFNFFKAVKDVGKAAKSVIKSPITKVAAGGLAVVFPPAGISAMAALTVADQVVRAAEQGADVAKKTGALKLIANTKAEAAKGDPNAKRALAVMKRVQAAPPATRAKLAAMPRFKVTALGRAVRVA